MQASVEISKFEVSGLDAKRFQGMGERPGNIRIDQNSSITQVTPLSEGEGQVAFRFCVNYSGLGYINITGEMLFSGPAHEIASSWVEKGNIPPETANTFHSAIVSSCMVAAVLIAREVKLPPPFPVPRVNVQTPAPKGPEVA